MNIKNFILHEKMQQLRRQLLAVEEDQAMGRTGGTADELDIFLDDVLEKAET